MVRFPGSRGCSRTLRSTRATGFVLGWAVALAGVAGAGAIAGAAAPAHAHPAGTGAAVPAAATSDIPASPALADGLLPTGAFGPGAQVHQLPADRLEQATGLARLLAGRLTSAAANLHVTPQACAAAVQQAMGELSSVREAAGEVAQGGEAFTAELLVSTSSRVDAVSRLTGALRDCASMHAASASHGGATAQVTPLAVPSVADGAAAVAVTLTGGRAGAASVTGSGLLGVVRDGDRVLLLAQGARAGEPDHQAFTALLERAATTEMHALD